MTANSSPPTLATISLSCGLGTDEVEDSLLSWTNIKASKDFIVCN